MRAVIFASGRLSHPDLDREHLRPDDWLIAADGGARHCQALALTPATIIGDFDSLAPDELREYERAGVEIISHPTRKDETDLELALRHALRREAGEVLILGGLGQRWDQSLANLLLAGASGLESLHLRLIDGPQEVLPLRGGQSIELKGRPGDTVSLIPLAGDALGVTTRGLEYPLSDSRLPFGATLGVSNVLTADSAHVSLAEGLLLCMIIHRDSDTR